MLKQVMNKLDRIERYLKENQSITVEYLNLEEAATFLKVKKSTLYQLVYHRKVPFYKRGKNLLFKKSELVDHIESKKFDSLEGLGKKVNLKMTFENN